MLNDVQLATLKLVGRSISRRRTTPAAAGFRQRLTEPFMWLITALGAAVFVSSAFHLDVGQLDLRFFLLTLVTISIASRLSVKIPRVKGEVTVSDTFIFLSMLLYGGEASILLAGIEAYCSATRFSKKRLTILFNAALLALSTFATVWLLRFCFGKITAMAEGELTPEFIVMLCLMALIQWVANAGLAAVRGALKTNQTVWYTWKNGYLWTCLTYFTGASAAGLIAKLTGSVSIYAFIIMAPIVAIVYFTYRTYLANVETSQQQAEQAQRHVKELSHHIAEQERISRALQESEEQFRNAFDHAAGMALVDTNGRWLQVNQSLCDMLGYTEEQLLDGDYQSLTHADDLGNDLVYVYQLLESKAPPRQVEKRYLHSNGQAVWVLQSTSVVRTPAGDPLHMIFQVQDITERKRAEEQIHYAAFHDALTGLPNRTLLSHRLSLAVERAKRHKDYQYAVLFLDLDRFKVVNDSLGHTLGDQLLMHLSRRLEQCIRKVDIVARLGGDEFAILLDGLEDFNVAIRIAERINEDLALPFELDGHEIFTTASIGIAYSTAGYQQPEDILRDADTAMYRAKSSGKARHEVFDKQMHERAVELLRLENDLRRAIERNEFMVHYQPIVALPSQKVVGFEALARWLHPERGIISPVDFIPLAEETGLIIQLGMFMLRESCRQTRVWQEQFPADPPLSISVNLSAKQFSQTDLVERIKQVLEDVGLAPQCLKLEITETVLMEKAENAIPMLMQLKKLGVQLSMDDFGTGYSSLSYLHRLPIDILKIDRSFVGRMGSDHESTGIVETIMTLAAKLNKQVIAEGVETAEQRQHLEALHCEQAQGYLFSKPLPTAEAAASLRQGFLWHAAPPVECGDAVHEISHSIN